MLAKKMNASVGFAIAICSAAMMAPTVVSASLIGTEITGDWDYVDTSLSPIGGATPSVATVGPGIEFSTNLGGSGFIDSADFSGPDGHRLELSYMRTGGGGTFAEKTWTFSDLDWGSVIGQLDNVIFDVASSVNGNATIGAIDATSFSITLPSLAVAGNSKASWFFDLEVTHNVPEPATGILLGLGLLGLGLARKKSA